MEQQLDLDLNTMPHAMNGKFQALFIGRSGSGKTELLYKLLKFGLAQEFKRIVLWCPSYDRTNSRRKPSVYDFISLTDSFPRFDVDHVSDCFDWVEGLNDNEPTLFIFDDCISEKAFKGNKGDSIMNKIAHRGRHANISTIALTQHYTGAAKQFREESDYYYIFSGLGYKEMDNIKKEIFSATTREQYRDFVPITNQYLKGKHDWIMYNKNERLWFDGKTDKIIEELC